jgi:hypothetical protein
MLVISSAASTGAVMVVVVVMVVVGRSRLSALKLLAHIKGILTISIILGLNIVDLIAKSGGIQVESSPVAPADMERNIIGAKHLLHGVLSSGHELGGKAELAVGAEDSKGGDVAVARLGGVLLHLGQNISHDLASVVLCHEQKLRPREEMVQVVLHLVVLWEAHQIARLHSQQVLYPSLPDAHHFRCLYFFFPFSLN